MRNSAGFMLYLIGLSMLGFLATDMYLPAFGAMQADLDTSAGGISASLSLFLAGFAIAQLAWGPLSDRIGRKPVLLLGLGLFALGCLGMLWVSNTTQLLILRFIQAIGVCSAAVSWQALVVDRFALGRAKRVFATIMPLVALSPALAPLIGAWLLNHFSWRAIFALLLIITVMLFIPTLRLKDLKKPRGDQTPRKALGYLALLKSPVFSGNVLIYAACSAGFFAWLTGSPFILGEMGYGPSDIGLSYVPQTLAFLVGGYSCRTALSRVDGNLLLPWLLVAYAISMVALYVMATVAEPTLVGLLIPFSLMALVNGASYPIIVANALMPFPESSGKAAALQNTLQLGLCFIASMLVSAFISHALITTVTIMLATILPVALGYFIQKRGKYRSDLPRKNTQATHSAS